jgi:hypothetical protein
MQADQIQVQFRFTILFGKASFSETKTEFTSRMFDPRLVAGFILRFNVLIDLTLQDFCQMTWTHYYKAYGKPKTAFS